MRLVALTAYIAMGLGLYGMLGYFTASSLTSLLHMHTPWQLWAYLGVVLHRLPGVPPRSTRARVIAALMSLEVLMLLVLSAAVLIRGGQDGISLAPLHPQNILASGTGAMFIGAVGAFVGFESAAVYAEEARNPERNVTWATCVSVGLLTVFYGFTVWSTASMRIRRQRAATPRRLERGIRRVFGGA